MEEEEQGDNEGDGREEDSVEVGGLLGFWRRRARSPQRPRGKGDAETTLFGTKGLDGEVTPFGRSDRRSDGGKYKVTWPNHAQESVV